MRTWPVILLLEDRKVLVVGGGDVAARKVSSLADAGADITVAAREAGLEIMKLSAEGLCRLEEREYSPGEAAGYFLVVAATDNMETNRAIAADAMAAGRLVNVVDQPELCNFIVPSLIRRGDLSVAISTGGAAPAFSKRLRERLEKHFPPKLGEAVDVLSNFRPRLMKSVADMEERKRIMTLIVNSPELDAFMEGDEKPLKELLSRWT